MRYKAEVEGMSSAAARMMNKMFIVEVSAGEYEERWTASLIVTFDFDKAKAYVEQCEAKEKLIHARLELMSDWCTAYHDTHDEEPYTGPESRERIRWRDGLKQHEITAEMRREREEIKAHNEMVYALQQVLQDAYNVTYEAAKEVYMKEIGIPEGEYDQYRSGHYRDERRYSIGIIDVI